MALFDVVTADLIAREWPVTTIDTDDLESSEAALMVTNLITPLLGSETKELG